MTRFLMILALALPLAACGGGDPDTSYADPDDAAREGSIFGEGGVFGLFGGSGREDEARTPGVVSGTASVNGYLWRAALDTVSFMPVASADLEAGIILTDWYSPPATADERFKLNVYVLTPELRADGVRVAVFRQQRTGTGWRDAEVADDTALDLENTILTRARRLRIAATD